MNHKMMITYRDELFFVEIPQDEQHMVSVIVEPEGMDVYLDGQPVDTLTGKTAQALVSTHLISAADQLIKAMETSEINLIKLSQVISTYKGLRGGNGMKVERTVKPPPPEIDLTEIEGEPEPENPAEEVDVEIPKAKAQAWGVFLSDIQKRTPNKPGQLVSCGCGTTISTFVDLKKHWLAGHDLSGKKGGADHPARAYMPQREGSSTD